MRQVIALGVLGKARSQGVEVLRRASRKTRGKQVLSLVSPSWAFLRANSRDGGAGGLPPRRSLVRPSVRARFLVFLLKIAVSGAETPRAPDEGAGVGGFRARARERALGVMAAK